MSFLQIVRDLFQDSLSTKNARWVQLRFHIDLEEGEHTNHSEWSRQRFPEESQQLIFGAFFFFLNSGTWDARWLPPARELGYAICSWNSGKLNTNLSFTEVFAHVRTKTSKFHGNSELQRALGILCSIYGWGHRSRKVSIPKPEVSSILGFYHFPLNLFSVYLSLL